MADTNVYQDVHNALKDFNDFLTSNKAAIKATVATLAVAVPQIGDVITALVGLMGKIRKAVVDVDLSAVPPVLTDIKTMTTKATAVFTAAKALIPDSQSDIDKILDGIKVVDGVAALTAELKGLILGEIDEIVATLNFVKP